MSENLETLSGTLYSNYMTISGCSFVRSTLCFNHVRRNIHCCGNYSPTLISRRNSFFIPTCCVRFFSVSTQIDPVIQELDLTLSGKKIRAGSRLGILNNKEPIQNQLEKQALEKGLLLEFRKDTERLLLAVAQKPDGKKNWMVCDQNGVVCSIKPQQVTYIVPGIFDFDHTLIADFNLKAQQLFDPDILECAWEEILNSKKAVTAADLAKILYGSAESFRSYCAHLLLSKDEIYFTTSESKGSYSLYEPRPPVQVEELQMKKRAKEAYEKEEDEFVKLLMFAKASDHCSKPHKSSWLLEDKIHGRIKALENYAIDYCKNAEEKKMAAKILRAMGLPRTSTAALNLLIDVGYFPVHVNLDLLKMNLHTVFSDELLLASEDLLSNSYDLDELNRKDLSFMKVYAIDVDEADELDDALSAMRLHDGRIKVWIHIADPACFIKPETIFDREARRRGTSIFLPTVTYPMFPDKLAMEKMSLQQGELCNAVSVSVTLEPDGSISDYTIENSVIRPTYMLTYESAADLLLLNLEEESELNILSEAASLRLQWRLQQGALDTTTIAPRIKVSNPDDPEPDINLYVENQASPAMRLVTEMMLLCGEAVATFGLCNNIPLPYRGQPQSNIPASMFAHLPEGPVRSAASVKILRAAEMDFRKPIRHGVLGLPGYVQFSSPIRRYPDLLAHYQVKAFLRGESLPFSASQLEGITSFINMHTRTVRKLSNTNTRYWLLEFLRRQPKGKKFRAVIIRFIKDRVVELFLVEVGIQDSASVSLGKQVGDEIQVEIEESHPRDDVLTLKEV